jgi:hypothetical protein
MVLKSTFGRDTHVLALQKMTAKVVRKVGITMITDTKAACRAAVSPP